MVCVKFRLCVLMIFLCVFSCEVHLLFGVLIFFIAPSLLIVVHEFCIQCLVILAVVLVLRSKGFNVAGLILLYWADVLVVLCIVRDSCICLCLG